jgi:hypothetical protein
MPCWKATQAALRKAVRSAELIRQAGGYRWVGLHEVTDREIAVARSQRSPITGVFA